MLSRAEKYQIKAQTALAVRECGGQEAAVEASDRLTRHQSLSEYGNAKMLDKFICLDTAAELDRFSGNPRFAKLLSSLAGGLFVPLPMGVGLSELAMAMGRSSKEHGEVMIALGQALADGKISCDERPQINREINEAMATLCALQELVNMDDAE